MARAPSCSACQPTCSAPTCRTSPARLRVLAWPALAQAAAVARCRLPARSTRTLDVLASARRPLLLAGLGAYRSGAAQPIAALADRLGALLTTTVMVDGLYRDSPWSLGICGGFASPRAARIMGDADVIVAFGASLNDFTLHGGMLLDPGAMLVQVDLAAAPTVGRVDLCVTGDAAQVARALLDGVRARGLVASSWRDEVAADIGLAGWEHEPYDDASTVSRIDPRSLSLALAGLLPAKRTLVMDGGHFVGWPAMYWPSADPSALVFTGAAFQTIGLGFAGAVGAAVGRTDRTTVVALGDGGALMGLPELETLIRVSRSALVVIFNDAAYGAEVHMYRPLVTDTSPATFGDIDFAAVARSFGARRRRCAPSPTWLACAPGARRAATAPTWSTARSYPT